MKMLPVSATLIVASISEMTSDLIARFCRAQLVKASFDNWRWAICSDFVQPIIECVKELLREFGVFR